VDSERGENGGGETAVCEVTVGPGEGGGGGENSRAWQQESLRRRNLVDDEEGMFC
jgi:hypothetical protein